MHKLRLIVSYLFIAVLLSGCTGLENNPAGSVNTTPDNAAVAAADATPTATVQAERVLKICMGQEPVSLFLYGDNSLAARNLRQAIYDGPSDVVDYSYTPVILESIPSLASDEAAFEPVQATLNSLVVDSQGKLANLSPGVTYYPAGCEQPTCAQMYQDQETVSMDQLVVRYKLRPGLTWSDGAPLTVDDSLYSYEVAQALKPGGFTDLLARTQSYLALDELTIEWRGIPGYRDPGYPANFFTPLPRHAWEALDPASLATAEISSRAPLGWGAYMLESWMPGQEISMRRSPLYYRSAEGLPRFDRLVFRFVSGPEQALADLESGACDLVDDTVGLSWDQLKALQQAGNAQVYASIQSGWEHLVFGLAPSVPSPGMPSLFGLAQIRQAVANCLDRQQIVNKLFAGSGQVLDSYIPADHPLFNPDARRYSYDPVTGNALLQANGWLDEDSNPSTPRRASGVAGVADGTPLALTFLTTDEPEKQHVAQIAQESLAGCGIQVQVSSYPAAQLFAPGPDGPIFGRNFILAQYGWASALEPPCFLFTTAEIPGPYPDYPKGWGGANAGGYSNPQYDLACQQALGAYPDSSDRRAAHFQAQAIFAEDLPAIPLYSLYRWSAARPDFCRSSKTARPANLLWDLESFDFGETCIQAP